MKATAVAGLCHIQLPRCEVDAGCKKTGSIPTLAEFRLRQTAIGTGRRQDIDADKDCRVQ